jgi:hypothetical protein
MRRGRAANSVRNATKNAALAIRSGATVQLINASSTEGKPKSEIVV